ncbi:MAG: efflux RND transporter permease subunit [Planctomycetia bacterium]
MKGLIEYFADSLYGIVVLAMLITVLGVVALISIPVDILPSFNTPAVQVLTYFQGMPAASVERTITNRIERWVNQAPGMSRIESRSLTGVSVIRATFRDGTNPNTALTMASSLALSTLPTLPPNTLPPVVLPFDPTATLPLGILVVRNPSMDESQIKDLARIELRNRLGGIPGVVAPVVVGGKDRTIMVYLDRDRMLARNLAPTDVVKGLQDGNLVTSPGNAYFGKKQMALELDSMVEKVDELNLLPIRVPGGNVISLGDLAHAEDTSFIQTSRVRVDGDQQVYVPIYRQGGASSLAVAGNVRGSLDTIQNSLPEGTTLEWVMDQSEGIRKSIASLIEEGILGAVLVAVMILVFLGSMGMTGIALLVLPLAVLFTILGLHVTGNTINAMTLGGLFLAIGPLVDNVIVVLENTQRHLGLGKNAKDAAVNGVSELVLPVLVATLAMMVVLAPVAFTPGVGGFLYRPLTIAVSLALVGTLFLCWTLVPMLASRWMKPVSKDHSSKSWFSRMHHKVEHFLDEVTLSYLALLGVAQKRRWLLLPGVVIASFLSLFLLPSIGKEFFPASDTGQINLIVQASSDSRLDGTEERIAEVERLIREIVPENELRLLVSEIGLTTDWSAAYTENSGQMDCVVRIQLADQKTRKTVEYARDIREAILQDPALADLKVSFNTGGIISAALNQGASSPIEVAILGGKITDAMEAAQRLENQIREIPGAVDVRLQQRNDLPVLKIQILKQKAAEAGLTPRDVAQQVVAAMNSSASIQRNFWIDAKSGNQYFVAVQYPENPDRTIEELLSIPVTGGSSGKPVLLGSLIQLDKGQSPVEIQHLQLARKVSILVNVDGRDLGSVAAEIQPLVDKLKVEKKLNITLVGEYGRMVETFQSLAVGFVLAVIFVYLLMVPLLQSFITPWVILVGIIPGFAGVIVTLFLTDTPINIQSIMGLVFLTGIVVSQGVLLVDCANKLKAEEGLLGFERASKAGSLRFGAILMSFLATSLDLLPLALGLSPGSETLMPLARAVIGGLITATALSLFMVPVLLAMIDDFRRKEAGA